MNYVIEDRASLFFAPNYCAKIQEYYQREKGKRKAQLSVLIGNQVPVGLDDEARGFQPKIKIIDF